MQPLKRAGFAQAGQVGQLALSHVAFCQPGVHAVKAEDDHPLSARFAVGLAMAQKAEQLAQRPGDEGVERVEEGDEQGPE